MPLLDLPTELLLQITTHIEAIRDIYHLALVSRSFSHLFEPEIHKRDALYQYGVELLRCAAEGDRGGILKMISLGADINFRPRDTLLHLKTVLFYPMQDKNIELVKLLLENGADPNLGFDTQRYMFYPLHKALSTSMIDGLDMINLLLDYGADPNLKDANQYTPLLLAAQSKHLPQMELLIARGADVNHRGRWGKTPLLQAIEHRGPQLEYFISKGSDVNRVDYDGISPLMRAMQSHDTYIAEALIHAGADVHFTNSNGRNAFHDAVMCGMPHNAELLLSHGADLNFIGHNGRNALFAALSGRNMPIPRPIPMLEFLLERGLASEIDSRDANQQTPLLYFASTPWREELAISDCRVMDVLLDHGASIAAKDTQGATVLHHVARMKVRGMIKWLCLEKGANVNERDINDESPIFWALKKFHKDDGLATVQELLDLGADYLDVNFDGQTLLCMAAHIWCPQSTSLFLERGADIHQKDNEGRTPLHWFAANEEIPRDKRSLEVLEILLAHGAQVNARTQAGATPLSMIRKKHTTRHIRKMLIDTGAVED